MDKVFYSLFSIFPVSYFDIQPLHRGHLSSLDNSTSLCSKPFKVLTSSHQIQALSLNLIQENLLLRGCFCEVIGVRVLQITSLSIKKLQVAKSAKSRGDGCAKGLRL